MSKTRLPRLRSLCVFCGSGMGTDPRWRHAAQRLGRAMAIQNVQLVYGGGHLGLMGALAEAVIAGGGQVIVIIPEHLTHMEQVFAAATELRVVDNMHTRKRQMFELSEAIAVLPGGMGTLDETFEMLTWKQLQLHHKPLIIVNQNNYWTPWLALADHIIANGFAHAETARLYDVVEDVDEVIKTARAGLAHAQKGEPNLF